jgi:hypothetical protein
VPCYPSHSHSHFHFHFHSLLRPRSGQPRSRSSSTETTSTTAPHLPCHKLGPPFSVLVVGGAMVRRYTLRIRDRICMSLVPCPSGCLRLPMAVVTQRSAPKVSSLQGRKLELTSPRGRVNIVGDTLVSAPGETGRLSSLSTQLGTNPYQAISVMPSPFRTR